MAKTVKSFDFEWNKTYRTWLLVAHYTDDTTFTAGLLPREADSPYALAVKINEFVNYALEVQEENEELRSNTTHFGRGTCRKVSTKE